MRVFDPIENRIDLVLKRLGERRETIEDPALARWLFGASWVADQGPWARSFKIWSSEIHPVRAWLVFVDALPDPAMLEEVPGDPRDILAILNDAQPLVAETPRPEEWAISLWSDDPAWVIVSQLADPQWTARWIGLDGQGEFDGEILPAFRRVSKQGGWQRIAVPASGRWTLRLEYDARDVAEGAAISIVAWLSWMLAALSAAFQPLRGRSNPDRNQTEA